MTLALSTLIRRTEGLLEAEQDGELLGMHIDNGACYAFNPTALRVWRLLETPKTVAELRDGLMAEFEVDQETCEASLQRLLHEMQRERLVIPAA